MTDEIHTTQVDPPGRKGGGRRAGSPASEGDVAAAGSVLNQSLEAGQGGEVTDRVTAPIPFDYQGRAIRTITKHGEICFVVEHTDPSKAVARLDDDEKGATTVRTLGGDQTMNVVTESGLYSLIFTSPEPESKAFRRWITGSCSRRSAGPISPT